MEANPPDAIRRGRGRINITILPVRSDGLFGWPCAGPPCSVHHVLHEEGPQQAGLVGDRVLARVQVRLGQRRLDRRLYAPPKVLGAPDALESVLEQEMAKIRKAFSKMKGAPETRR